MRIVAATFPPGSRPSPGYAAHAGHPSPTSTGERFGARAARLAGIAGALLGWRPDEFWRATPAELAMVIRALAGEAEGGDPLDGAGLSRMREMFPDG